MTTGEQMKRPFNNAEFTAWLVEFEKALIECGMPQGQVMRYRNEYHTDAVKHFMFGDSPDEAAVKQLL